jgi:hypothetical protein
MVGVVRRIHPIFWSLWGSVWQPRGERVEVLGGWIDLMIVPQISTSAGRRSGGGGSMPG